MKPKKMNQYWIIQDPNIDDYERSIFVNGVLEHKFGLPGVQCEVCGDAWGTSRVLPVVYSKELGFFKELQNRSPISVKKHRKLLQGLEKVFTSKGYDIELMPGDSFLPGTLKLLSKPRSSFLWPANGGIIVNQQVKKLFEQNKISGVKFFRVDIEAVGDYEPYDSMFHLNNINFSDEVFNRIKIVKDPESFGPLYEMIVIYESGNPAGLRVISKCIGCGYEEIDNESCDYSFIPDNIPNKEVFLMATTLYTIVDSRVRDLITKSNLTNVSFKELSR